MLKLPGAPSIAPLPFATGGIRCILLAVFAFLRIATTASAQWEIEDSHTNASLRGIANVGGGVAWASGTGGTVLRTLDGGKTWQTCPIPLAGTKDTAEKLDFRGIQAFDEKTAIVMSSGPGDQSRLYKTTDGCQTWKLVTENTDPKGFWDVIQLQHKDYGLLGSKGCGVFVGDPIDGAFDVHVSIDILNKHLGEGWFLEGEEPVHYAASDGEALFAASNSSAIIFGSRRFIIATGGKNGSHVLISPLLLGETGNDPAKTYSVPIVHGSESAGIFSIDAKDLKTIVAVGGDYKKPEDGASTAAVSFDGGKKWLPAQTPPHGYRSAVAYDPDKKTWITVGPNGTDISTDDGRNWRPLTPTPQDAPDADKNWNALSLPFVVGPKGRIGKLRATALGSVRTVKPGER